MIVLKIIGAILLICLLIGFLRLGAILSFGDSLRVQLRVGPIKLTIVPRGKKKPKENKKKPEKPDHKPEKEPRQKKKRSIPKPTLDDILDLIDTAFAALGATARRACRRVRIDPLELTVVFGWPDPADAARMFGAANTLMYAVMPKAEEVFYIPDPSLHLRIDFDREWPTASGSLGLSVRVCDLLAIALTLVVPLGKWFLRFKKSHKHDKPAHTDEIRDEATEHQDTEEQIA